MTPENIISNYCQQHRLLWGLTSFAPFFTALPRMAESSSILKGFAEPDLALRTYPSKTFSEGKTILAVAMAYGSLPSSMPDQKLRGNISQSAVGLDYHIVLRRHLDTLLQLLQNNWSFSFERFVDTGPLPDREVAWRAGIGSFGKNHCLYAPQWGSRICLGYAFMTLALKPSSPCQRHLPQCASCQTCIASCPSGALQMDHKFLPNRCISYLTQKKGVLSLEEMKTMGRQLYGCDVCQTVCPYNQSVSLTKTTDLEALHPQLETILSLTNKDFRALFQDTAAGWRGKKTLQRNALIALGNIGGEESKQLLQSFVSDTRLEISETAKRAIIILEGGNHGILERSAWKHIRRNH